MVKLVRKKSQDILNRLVDDVKIGHDSLKYKKSNFENGFDKS